MEADSKDNMGNKTEKGEFPAFSFESFSQGKDKKNPDNNEDVVFVDSNTIAVIDGATSKGNLNFEDKTGGQYAALAIAGFLKDIGPEVNDVGLINQISGSFAKKLLEDGYENAIQNNPEARPTASFVVAHITPDGVVITQLGDVGFRVNGKEYNGNAKEIDRVNAEERKKAIERKKAANPDISRDALLECGREAIIPMLNLQVIKFQNNSDSKYGYGALDGKEVPSKYVRTYRFKISEISILEIASDGYFLPANEPTIDSWEEATSYVEKVDPDKIGQFLSTKGSTGTSFTDDRTIVIANFKS